MVKPPNKTRRALALRPSRLLHALCVSTCACIVATAHAQPKPPISRLSDAIESRDHARLKSLLSSGEPPNAICLNDQTCLEQAILHDDLEAINLLLDFGADLNTPDHRGTPPIIYAVDFTRADVLELLLKRGADVEARDHLRHTALIQAVNRDSIPMVRMLLKAGADVNATDKTGISLLMKASLANTEDMIPLLERAGAHLDSPGDSMIAAASNGDAIRLRKLIAAGAPVDFRGPRGETALIVAARKGQTVAVRALLAAGADVHAVARESSATPLFAALESNHRTTIDEILAAGADPTEKLGMGGVTTLMWLAGHSDDAELAERLIAAGVDPNAVTTNGSKFTALHQAATMGHIAIVRLLLVHHADVNAATALEGDTPLIDAARSGNAEIVMLLLKTGADPTARDHRTIPGKTAEDWAIQFSHPDIAAMLHIASHGDIAPNYPLIEHSCLAKPDATTLRIFWRVSRVIRLPEASIRESRRLAIGAETQAGTSACGLSN